MSIGKQRNRVGEVDRWLSLLGGGALVYWGFKRGSKAGTVLALAGGTFLVRGFTGQGPVFELLGWGKGLPYGKGLKLRRSLTINRPADELYRYWHNFENLAAFMEHLESVTRIDERRSHWVAKGPAGSRIEWDSEITTDRENEIIGWRSLEGAEVDNAGSVRFEPAPGARGTIVRVQMQYLPPAGKLGAVVAKLFGEEPEQQIREDLRRFKQIMEAGEIPTTKGQPTGRARTLREQTFDSHRPAFASLRKPEPVETASEDSFPASDAPAWTAGGGT
jgi:uncharacterized membrane protein